MADANTHRGNYRSDGSFRPTAAKASLRRVLKAVQEISPDDMTRTETDTLQAAARLLVFVVQRQQQRLSKGIWNPINDCLHPHPYGGPGWRPGADGGCEHWIPNKQRPLCDKHQHPIWACAEPTDMCFICVESAECGDCARS